MFGFFKKKKQKPFVTAILAAGGTGSRMGQNKLLIEIGDMPVIAHSLKALESCDLIDEIIISAHRDHIVEYGNIAKEYGISKLSVIISGGNTRTESVYNGISQASEKSKFILVHDAARPFVSKKEIEDVIAKAFTYGAATVAVPVKDTIKAVDGDKISKTIKRDKLVQVQTPQVFDKDILKGALSNVITKNIPVTDDCQAAEIMGFYPHIVIGSYDNIKITTPEDLFFGQAILNKREVTLK